MAENLAANVVEMYAEAERTLLARIARSLAKGLDAPDWVTRKLAEVQFLQRQTERLVADLGNRAASEVALALAHAYNRGGASAVVDLAALLEVSLEEAAAPLYGLPPVELLVAETMGFLVATHPRILRATMDAYRSVIAEAAGRVLTGSETRRQAAQFALDRFAARGITGFVDKAGRGWNLVSYVEMAMRTGCGKAAVQGHIDRLQEYGLDLVIVSDAPKECPLCRPWEGKVLSIGGDGLPLDGNGNWRGPARCEEVSPEEFAGFRNRSSYPEMLTDHPVEWYSENRARCYRVPGVDAGYALYRDAENDGKLTLIAVHNNHETIHSLGTPIIDDAVKNGAEALDCYDGHLASLYAGSGFREVASKRMRFLDEYAPDGWDYEKRDRPDIVFMDRETTP
jgi:hypothetical protein